MSDIILSDGQEIAMQNIKAFLEDGTSFFTLLGKAGTGKTFITQQLMRLVAPAEVAITAPTNKAVTVLRKFNQDVDVMCLTIHKFLGLKVGKKQGKSILIKNKRFDPSQFADINLVIVDEASMIPDDLLKRIQRDANDWGRKYLFIGDPFQLPPVDHTETKAFNIGQKYELTEIIRQAKGNPIIACADAIRKAIDLGDEPKLIPGTEGKLGVELVNRKEFEERIRNHFKSHNEGETNV